MPGMNKTARQYRLIESFFGGLENDPNTTAAEAMLLLDELRRLERKWREQVEAGSPRRIESDFRTLEGWYRRWLLASKRALERGDDASLRQAAVAVQDELNKPR